MSDRFLMIAHLSLQNFDTLFVLFVQNRNVALVKEEKTDPFQLLRALIPLFVPFI